MWSGASLTAGICAWAARECQRVRRRESWNRETPAPKEPARALKIQKGGGVFCGVTQDSRRALSRRRQLGLGRQSPVQGADFVRSPRNADILRVRESPNVACARTKNPQTAEGGTRRPQKIRLSRHEEAQFELFDARVGWTLTY